jgi:hypothetical protein
VGASIEAEAIVWLDSAELDGDSRDDLAYVSASSFTQASGDLVLNFIQPGGLPGHTAQWPGVSIRPLIADVLGDEAPDLVLTGRAHQQERQQFGPAVVYRNEGKGTFVPAVVSSWRTEASEPTRLFTLNAYGLFVADGAQVVPIRVIPYLEDLSFEALGVPALLEHGTQPIAERDWPENPSPLQFAAMTGSQLVPGESGFEPEITLFKPDDHGSLAATPVYFSPEVVSARGWVGFFALPGDEIPDLVAAGGGEWDDEEEQQPVAVYASYGQADGSFDADPEALGSDYTLGDRLFEWDQEIVLMQDLDLDGWPDFVLSEALVLSGVDNCVVEEYPEFDGIPYCCSDPDPEPGPGYACFFMWGGIRKAVVAELTGDGFPDIAGSPESGESLWLSVGSVSGEYTARQELEVGADIRDIESTDINGDENPDLVVLTQGPDGPDGLDDEVLVYWGGSDAWADGGTPLVSGVELAPFMSGEAFGTPLWLMEDRGSEVAIARMLGIGDRRLGSELVGEDVIEGDLHAAVVGAFTQDDSRELTLAGSGQAASVKLAPNENGLHEFSLLTPWELGATPGFNNDLPEFGANGATLLAGDLDGDEIDEMVWVGASEYSFDPDDPDEESEGAQHAAGDGLVNVYRRVENAWSYLHGVLIPDLPAGGAWPSVVNPRHAELVDVDGDDDLDLILIGGEAGQTQQLVIVPNEDGWLAQTAVLVAPDTSWDGLSSMGPGLDGLQRIVGVSQGQLSVSTIDPETYELEERSTQAAPEVVRGITTGDFDADGLVDVALATDDGVSTYRGVVAIPD